MVDEEVEKILLEIRERVRAQELPAPDVANSAMENGAGESAITSRETGETSATEALGRIESYLTITARAWDRLPPLVSNRSGVSARLELWVKRLIKRAAHWFTWEQINFNAAVHHTLRDTLQTLTNHEQASQELRVEAHREIERQTEALRELNVKIEVQRAAQGAAQRAAQEAAQQAERVVAQRKAIDARLAELTRELNGRAERIEEEQRVCFKQLSLEATEASVLEDRARRKAERLMEDLGRRVEQLERAKKES